MHCSSSVVHIAHKTMVRWLVFTVTCIQFDWHKFALNRCCNVVESDCKNGQVWSSWSYWQWMAYSWGVSLFGRISFLCLTVDNSITDRFIYCTIHLFIHSVYLFKQQYSTMEYNRNLVVNIMQCPNSLTVVCGCHAPFCSIW